VKALNDGGVTIDGQFAHVPVEIGPDNNWWVIEGINAKNSKPATVRLRGSNNIVRRVVAWDSEFRNGESFSCHSGANNLFEDVAAFGIANWHFSNSQNRTGSCTFRRAWGRFEGSAAGDNNGVAFGGLFYNAASTTCENCISEYFPNTGLTAYQVDNPTSTSSAGCPVSPSTGQQTCTDGAPAWPGGLFNINRWDNGSASDHSNDYDGQLLGSIGYVRAGANLSRMGTGSLSQAFVYGANGREGGNIVFKDLLLFIDPTHTQFGSMRALRLDNRPDSNPSHLTNVSTVAGTVNSITSYWKQSGVVHASNLAGLNAANANPWTGTAGANVCFRYVDRVKTTTPLWPWPMNERIKAAMAAAGQYSGPCLNCKGTFPLRNPIDVTAEIEKLLGPIPAYCRQ
jgi:hypothetical protein